MFYLFFLSTLSLEYLSPDVKTPPAFIIQINEISISLILSAFNDESDCHIALHKSCHDFPVKHGMRCISKLRQVVMFE